MTARRRISRKLRRCGCGTPIEPGHVYLVHTLFPGNDVMEIPHPIQLPECAECAARYGREWDLGPIPTDQPYRYWLADGPQDPDPFGIWP